MEKAPIKVHFSSETAGLLRADFDVELHKRGTDFSVNANKGYKPHAEDDGPALLAVLTRLFEGGAGVTSVTVNNVYTLRVFHSQAFTVDSIKQAVMEALKGAGYDVTELAESGVKAGADLKPSRPWLRLTVPPFWARPATPRDTDHGTSEENPG